MNARSEALVPAAPETQLETRVSGGKRLSAFVPSNLSEAIQFAKMIANSDLAPKDFKNKPANVLIAMQMGAEVGLAPMQAIQNIAVINGRPCIWGDAALAIVQTSPHYEWHKEKIEGQGMTRTAHCTVKRKQHEPYTTTFSMEDAKKAKLIDKDGTWQTYPDRMLQMRARGFALRDKFADSLKGLILAEEAGDIQLDATTNVDAIGGATVATPRPNREVGTLEPSREPNRGHGNEGMNRTKAADEMCNECRAINGHLPSCSKKGAPQTIDAKSEQERRTSKPTNQYSVLIESIERKTKKAKGDKPAQPYLVLHTLDAVQNKFDVYVWKTDLHPFLLEGVNQVLMCEVSHTDSNNRTYLNLEHILQLGTTKFVDNKPAAEGEVSVSDLFGGNREREPGEDEDIPWG